MCQISSQEVIIMLFSNTREEKLNYSWLTLQIVIWRRPKMEINTYRFNSTVSCIHSMFKKIYGSDQRTLLPLYIHSQTQTLTIEISSSEKIPFGGSYGCNCRMMVFGPLKLAPPMPHLLYAPFYPSVPSFASSASVLWTTMPLWLLLCPPLFPSSYALWPHAFCAPCYAPVPHTDYLGFPTAASQKLCTAQSLH